MSTLARSWHARPAGERRVIAVVAAAAAAALLAAFVWLPLERERARLARELPALRASIDALQRDAAEVTRLRALPPVAAATTPQPLAALAGDASLAGAQVAVLDERRVRVTGADVSYGALLEWLGTARARHGLRVESATLDALPAAGRVRAELLLARS